MAASIPVSKSLWGDPDDFSKFIDGIVFQWYHLNTILPINCFLSKAIYIFLQLYFGCQRPSRAREGFSVALFFFLGFALAVEGFELF